MIHFWNWIYWCWKRKRFLTWNVGYISTKDLTEEEKEYAESLDIESLLCLK